VCVQTFACARTRKNIHSDARNVSSVHMENLARFRCGEHESQIQCPAPKKAVLLIAHARAYLHCACILTFIHEHHTHARTHTQRWSRQPSTYDTIVSSKFWDPNIGRSIVTNTRFVFLCVAGAELFRIWSCFEYRVSVYKTCLTVCGPSFWILLRSQHPDGQATPRVRPRVKVMLNQCRS
jgi:hypothetical protein